MMARNNCSAGDAEAMLFDLADVRHAEVNTVAAKTVRALDLDARTTVGSDTEPTNDVISNVRILGRATASDGGGACGQGCADS